MRWRRILVWGVLLAAACGGPPSPRIDRALLQGGWASAGENFDFVIHENTILFEFDMKEHPYELQGDVVIIDFEDPTLGTQRKHVVRLTPEVLEWEDETSGVRGTYHRLEG